MRTALVITLCLLPCLTSGMYNRGSSLLGGRRSSGLGRSRIFTIPDGTPDYRQVIQSPTGRLYQVEDQSRHLIGGRIRTVAQLENLDVPDRPDPYLITGGGSSYVGGGSFGGLQSLAALGGLGGLGGRGGSLNGGSLYGGRGSLASGYGQQATGIRQQPSLFGRRTRY
ncbi:uncharacterized protein LOC124132089 isoform X2 [Haliotis rufescens]|uniref:uncharacterized protein LOC124132089 isoform X2 n=1 Tax=Haliotis rufescens TaxID=6454 RepID=UPI00201E75E3|nr:uncharacterized protein LOC124132089 isoform X2 [Haliotis rufescens]